MLLNQDSMKKGMWYKIGVIVSNQTDEYREVSVEVKGAEIRIASDLDNGD